MDIAPFRGLRYDPTLAGDLATVTAPPYDVISPDARIRFEQASPYNVVRLVLPQDEGDGPDRDKYTRAAGALGAWLREGALVPDEAEGLTVYEQRFALAGEERVQRGVVAAVGLEEGGSILPHERTVETTVEDRLRLLRATRANLDCVLGVYSAGDAGVRDLVARTVEGEPHAAFRTGDDGVAHRAWRMTDPGDVEAVRRALAGSTVLIADGHHRYRTALRYREERRAADGPGPWDAIMFYLVDAEWCGPALLPIHRLLEDPAPDEVLERVSPAFRVERASHSEPERLARELEQRRAEGRTYALLAPGRAWWLTVADKAAEAASLPADRSPVWRDLDVAVLESLVFERLLGGVKPGYAHSASEAAGAVERGAARSAFLLAAPPFESVRSVALAGEAMPPKSTFFVPKPRTGLVIRPL